MNSLNPNSRRLLAWDRAYDQAEDELGPDAALDERAEELMAEWAAAEADGHPDA